MVGYQSHAGSRSDWLASALFNIFIFVIPFIAANLLISGYGGVPHNEPATAEILPRHEVKLTAPLKIYRKKVLKPVRSGLP